MTTGENPSEKSVIATAKKYPSGCKIPTSFAWLNSKKANSPTCDKYAPMEKAVFE
jgi:hypothetical protein